MNDNPTLRRLDQTIKGMENIAVQCGDWECVEMLQVIRTIVFGDEQKSGEVSLNASPDQEPSSYTAGYSGKASTG